LVPSLDAEASRLFVERASAVNRALVWDARNVAGVAAVCRSVDGLPLAIELAAAWADVLTPAEIADRLAREPSLVLASGRGTPRQRTLRTAVDWSLALLSADARAVFDQLSAFGGGFDLAGAEAVVGGDVLPLLAQLVTASLVVREPIDGEGRYRLLEPLHQ